MKPGNKLLRLNVCSVRFRLIIAFAIILIIPSMAIGWISITVAASKVDDQMKRAAYASINMLNQTITQMIEGQMKDIDFLARQISVGSIGSKLGDEDPKIRETLDTYIQLHPELEAVFVGTDQGGAMGSPIFLNLSTTYDPRNRPWYEQAMKNKGKVIITDVFLSSATNNVVVSVAKTVNDGHGVVGVNVRLKSLFDIVMGIKIGNQGYAILHDKTKKVIVHPMLPPGSNLPALPVYDSVYDSESGTLEYINPVDGKPKRMVFTTNALTGWKLLGTWYEDEVKQEAAAILKITISVIAVAVLIGAVIVFVTMRSLPSPMLERKYQILYEHAPLAILLLDEKARIHDVNPIALRMFDMTADEIQQRDFPSLLGLNDRNSFISQSENGLLNQKIAGREFIILKSSQEQRLVSAESEFITISGEQFQYVILRDITESRDAEQRIAYLAYHDELTGLSNRSMFHRQLTAALNQINEDGFSIAVLLLDLDRFKLINDTKGHHAGDLLLKHVAIQLMKNAPSEMKIARLGGDEFAMFVPGIENDEQLHQLAQYILNGLKSPFMYESDSYYITASLGICLAPGYGDSSEVLLKHADIAMYAAKTSGRDRYQIYSPQLTQPDGTRLSMETRLREAIESNEFELYYQPQIDMESREIMGVEALIRWMSPEEGVVSPAEFIPLAEELGLIIPIGRWVLMQACTDMKKWIGTGLPPMTVSVNISPVQFRNEQFLSELETILAQTGIDPNLLCLEITESTALENQKYSMRVCQEIVNLNVRLSIDDFGTGYSSFSLLKQLQFDAVKIDRSFVQGIARNDHDAAIIKAIIAMAHGLNQRVVAEGIEEAEQWDKLMEMKCDFVQGYYISKPIPEKELVEFILKRFALYTNRNSSLVLHSELLECADNALSRAKKTGRNKAVKTEGENIL